MSNNPTTIRVHQGSDVEVQGSGTIRVMVIDGSTGNLERREIPAGSTLGDAVSVPRGQMASVNGQPAAADRPLQDGDKVTTSPTEVAGA